MLESKVNEFLTLKLENSITNIYIKDKKFIQCKRLVINILKQEIPKYDEVNSIDEAVEAYGITLLQNRMVEGPMARLSSFQNETITPEQEFWGHCSNIQTWCEHDYDTRLLHSNLAFPLLRALVDAGDMRAKKVLKTEIMERLESRHPNVIKAILSAGLLEYLSLEEKRQIIQQNASIILNHIENFLKFYPNLILYFFKDKLLDYLNPKEKEQLLKFNYHAILKFFTKLYGFYPKKILDIFEDISQDNQGQVELKLFIQKNFPIILKEIETLLKEIERIWKYHPKLFLYFFEERLLNHLISKEKIQQNYPKIFKSGEEKKSFILKNFPSVIEYLEGITVEFEIKGISETTISIIFANIIEYIKGTKFLDDFFNAIAQRYQLKIFFVMLWAIGSIKTSDDLKNDIWKKWKDILKYWMVERRKEWMKKEKERRERAKKVRFRERFTGPKIESMWLGIQSMEEVYDMQNRGKFSIALKLFEATNKYKSKNRERIVKRLLRSPDSFQSYCQKKEKEIWAMDIPIQKKKELIKNNTLKWLSEWQREKRSRNK